MYFDLSVVISNYNIGVLMLVTGFFFLGGIIIPTQIEKKRSFGSLAP